MRNDVPRNRCPDIVAGAGRIDRHAQGIVDLVFRIDIQQVREVAGALLHGRHRIGDFTGTRRLAGLVLRQGKEPEELALAVKHFGDKDGTAESEAVIVRMPAGLHRLRSQLTGKRAVSGGGGGIDVLEILLFDEERCGVPPRVPILLGRRSVKTVGAGLGRKGDAQADGMSHGSVETGGVDLVLRDLVGERRERNSAAAEVWRSVDTPLVLSKGERRKEARVAADHPLREELCRALIHHSGRHARQQDDVVGHHRQVHDFGRSQRLTGVHRTGVENRGFGGDGDGFAQCADFQLDIDIDLVAHLEGQAGANDFLEPGRLYGDLILAARQQRALHNSRWRSWSAVSRRWSRCWSPSRWRRVQWRPPGLSPFLKSYPWCPGPAKTTPSRQTEP